MSYNVTVGGAFEELLASYQTSFNTNLLQKVCQDTRNLPDRLQIIEYILETSRSIDVNDETFEHVVQTTLKLKNRPDAIPEVRRRQVPAVEDDNNNNEREDFITLTQTGVIHQKKPITTNTGPQFSSMPASSLSPTTPSSTTTSISTSNNTASNSNNPQQEHIAALDSSQNQYSTNPSSSTTTTSMISSSTTTTTTNSQSHDRATTDPSSSLLVSTSTASSILGQGKANVSLEAKVRLRDMLIVHLCQELQHFQTQEQYTRYCSSLFDEYELHAPPYSEKRGGLRLRAQQQTFPHTQTTNLLDLQDELLLQSQQSTSTAALSSSTSQPTSQQQQQQQQPPTSSLLQPSVQPSIMQPSSTSQQQQPPQQQQQQQSRTCGLTPYYSALQYICSNTQIMPNRDRILSVLLQHGASPNGWRDYGISPLYDIIINPAIQNMEDRIHLLKLLLTYGAKVDQQDYNKNNLIHIVVSAPHLTLSDKKRIITLLREHHININCPNRHGHSPLETLCFSYQEQTLLPHVKALFLPARNETILNNHTNSYDNNSEIWTQTIPAQQQPTKLFMPSSKSNQPIAITPLSVTSCRLVPETLSDRLDLAQFLLHCGASIVGTTPGTTLLTQLAANNFPNRLAFINLLLNNEAPIDLVDNSGDTALHCILASDEDKVALIQLLWQKSIESPFIQHSNQSIDRSNNATSSYTHETDTSSITTTTSTSSPLQQVTSLQPSQQQQQQPTSSITKNKKQIVYHTAENNIGIGLSLKKECIDILDTVFTHHIPLTKSNQPQQQQQQQQQQQSLTVQSIPEDSEVANPTDHEPLQQQNSQCHIQPPIVDGFEIGRVLLKHGAHINIVNKNEYRAIDQHYLMLRGSLALNPAFHDEFNKLSHLESFTPNIPASEIAAQTHDGTTEYEELIYSDYNLRNRTLPLEMPFTNLLAQNQHKKLQENYPTITAQHNDNDNEYSVSYYYYPHDMPNEMPIVAKSAVQPITQIPSPNSHNYRSNNKPYKNDDHHVEYSVSHYDYPTDMPNEMPIFPKQPYDDKLPVQPITALPRRDQMIELDQIISPKTKSKNNKTRGTHKSYHSPNHYSDHSNNDNYSSSSDDDSTSSSQSDRDNRPHHDDYDDDDDGADDDTTSYEEGQLSSHDSTYSVSQYADPKDMPNEMPITKQSHPSRQ